MDRDANSEATARHAPIRVRVGDRIHVTCKYTLQRYPTSLLAALFESSSNIYDPMQDVWLIPDELVSATSFDFILEYLRAGEWLPIAERAVFEDLDRSCKVLGLPISPPEQTFINEGSAEVISHKVLTLCTPSQHGLNGMHEQVIHLGRLGYRVATQAPKESRVGLLSAVDALNNASPPSGTRVEHALFVRKNSEMVSLKRLLEWCGDVSSAAPWLAALLQHYENPT